MIQGVATAGSAYVGGLIGSMEYRVNLSGSYNSILYVYGYATDTAYVGGLVGKVFTTSTYGAIIYDCFNVGKNVKGYAQDTVATKYVGGLFGHISSNASGTGMDVTDLIVRTSYNAGQESPTGIYADTTSGPGYRGQIAGYASYVNWGYYSRPLIKVYEGGYVIWDDTYKKYFWGNWYK